MIWALDLLPKARCCTQVSGGVGEEPGSRQSCSVPSGPTRSSLFVSLGVHFICLFVDQCLPGWCWLFSSQHLGLGNQKSILEYHLNSWKQIRLSWLHSPHPVSLGEVQGGPCGLSTAVRTLPYKRLEEQVSVKQAVAGKNLQSHLLTSCLKLL